jgi:hypothetical protein
MKRKSPVELCLVDSECEESSSLTHASKIYNQSLTIDSNPLFTLDAPKCVVLLPCPCTPSPPMSPVMRARNEPQRSAPKSLLRKSKRKLVAKYRDCIDLVEPQRDASFASDCEILLVGPTPCFRCRLCPQSSSSTFSCKTVCDLNNIIPDVEQHLLRCNASPGWLRLGITEAKARHASQTSPRKPYSSCMVWKRVLAHALCSHIRFTTRVKFAEKLCHERIIPAREPKCR